MYDLHTIKRRRLFELADRLTWKAGMVIPSNASGRSSMSTFANVAASLCSAAMLANTGAILTQGLHQPAVKSTIKSGFDLTQEAPFRMQDVTTAAHSFASVTAYTAGRLCLSLLLYLFLPPRSG